MRYAFFFGPVALTVRYHVAHAPDGAEHGARLELQRLDESIPSNESEAWMTTIKDPIWRGDLFTFAPGAPGNWDRAHYHSRFDGWVPAESPDFMGREWDPALMSDPVGWTRRQLGDVRLILERGGAGDIAPRVDQAEVDGAMDAITSAIEACLQPPAPTTVGVSS